MWRETCRQILATATTSTAMDYGVGPRSRGCKNTRSKWKTVHIFISRLMTMSILMNIVHACGYITWNISMWISGYSAKLNNSSTISGKSHCGCVCGRSSSLARRQSRYRNSHMEFESRRIMNRDLILVRRARKNLQTTQINFDFLQWILNYALVKSSVIFMHPRHFISSFIV